MTIDGPRTQEQRKISDREWAAGYAAESIPGTADGPAELPPISGMEVPVNFRLKPRTTPGTPRAACGIGAFGCGKAERRICPRPGS